MKTGLLAGACLIALLSAAAAARTAHDTDARTGGAHDAGKTGASHDGHGVARKTAFRPIIGGHGDDVGGFIAQHDDNGDGRLTWTEFETFRRNRFDATDENGDGTVDVEEYVREFEDRSRRALEQRRAGQMEQAKRRFAALNGDSDRQTRVRFRALDADKDGRMTFAEYQVSGKRLFDGADRDKDGVVDAADAALPPPAGDSGN